MNNNIRVGISNNQDKKFSNINININHDHDRR